jgi:hypothetical protein
MHPEITRRLAVHRQAELARDMSLVRTAGLARGAARRRRSAESTDVTGRAPAWRAALRLAGGGVAARGGRGVTPPIAFAAEPEAFGVRVYLTAQEAQQLAAEWAERLSRYTERLDDPRRRPAGAQPFELVILGRQVPALD